MRFALSRTLPIAFLSLIAAAVHAASFDCTKARTRVERMICDDAQVSELDRRLAGYYAGAQQHFKDSGECLKRDQREWLRGVRNACGSLECLKSAYLNRLAELDEVQPGVSAIRDFELPRSERRLISIVPPNGDASTIPPAASAPRELTGRYAFQVDYGLTFIDERGRLYVLAGLLNQNVPPELEALEKQQVRLLARGRVLTGKPSMDSYPGLAAPDGEFDPHECVYLYRAVTPEGR